MCQWYCTSEGPFTNLHCLHCSVRYCGACLHGEAGKMESLVRCAGCGKKPRIKANAQRRGWGHEVASPQGTSKTVMTPPQRGKTTQAYWAYKNAAQHQGEFTWDATPQNRTIFDKLTDPSLYTGSHKHRFDEEGRGRGLEGRDSVAKGLGTSGVTTYYGEGTVVSIAQLVRNEKLDPQHMNKIKHFPDGTSILSPQNRSWKHADTRWRPEMPRGLYPHNNPTYQRTPSGSPARTPSSARQITGSPSAPRLMPAHEISQLTQPTYATPQQHHQYQHQLQLQQQQQHYEQQHQQQQLLMQQQQQQQLQHHPQHAPQQTPPQPHPMPASAASWSAAQAPRSPAGADSYARPASASHQSSPAVFDPALYTGGVDAEPEHFTADTHASPVVHDLSQITRTQFNAGDPKNPTGHQLQY